MKEVYIEESNGLGFIEWGQEFIFFINIFSKHNFKIKWGPNKKYWEAQEGSERDKMEIRIISLKASKIYHCNKQILG